MFLKSEVDTVMEEKNMNLANKLKELRKDFCMTQDELAELLGMSRTSFSKYENGAANPPLTVMRKMAAIFNVPIEYLIHDEQKNFVLNSNPDAVDDADSSKFFTQLTDEERKLVLRFRLMNKEEKERALEQFDSEE